MDESPDDWTLLFAWREGDMPAGEQLATRYFGLLTRFFLNKVRDANAAADLVSDTFLGCVARKGHIEETGKFRSFLFAIAMNKLRGYYRKQAKRRRELEDFVDVCVANTLPRTPSSLLAHAQEARLLVAALRRLSLAQQIVLELNAFEGLRGPEIADLLGVPVATVYTHLRRGRKRLETVVGQLTTDPKLAHSTMTNLEGWALAVRAKVEEVTDEKK